MLKHEERVAHEIIGIWPHVISVCIVHRNIDISVIMQGENNDGHASSRLGQNYKIELAKWQSQLHRIALRKMTRRNILVPTMTLTLHIEEEGAIVPSYQDMLNEIE